MHNFANETLKNIEKCDCKFEERERGLIVKETHFEDRV